MSATQSRVSRLDHLVVIAPTLDAGAVWVRAALGAECRPGGRHDRMGTHNRLLRLGDLLYLEVIAADPAAPAPDRPRWFGLDDLAPDAAPRLVAWVARSDDVVAVAAACPELLGPVEPMSRGDLQWRLTIPPDGFPPLDGAGPLLIQWETADHPAPRLPDDGLTLVGLDVTHPNPDRVRRLLTAIGFAGPVAVAAGDRVTLTAEVRTPTGVGRLESAG
jgi:hypothetical protein